MKSLLKKALSQIAIVPALPESRRPEVRCKSSRKNQSRGQLKRLRNELYRRHHSKKVTWKIFSSKKDPQPKPDKCGSVKPKNISKVSPDLIKIAKQINQSRRDVFEATPNRMISKKTESVLFNKDYDNFRDDLKTLICS
ncbi:unnamed protein product [Schistosoma rodhaini]|uniref:Active regulator of SIRT1 n=1 Tax=Schistosoma mansoni TaxID=6183 RepID=A0A3Q0KMU0_SCHMA|nr:unnamed protein product [Schistosoma rodhaini]